MRVLDLFSGIGGFSLGLERAGMRTVAFCEIDPFCRRVLAKRWPEVSIYDDVRTITAELLRADGIAADLVCGGFPCQDISLAGAGAGLDGARSGLWHEMLRIIAETRPRYVIAENVAALRGRGLDSCLRGLASVGYDAEWHCIPASAVGAPHRRDRVWIIANPEHGRGRRFEPGRGSEGRNRDEPAGYGAERNPCYVADANGTRLAQRQSERGHSRPQLTAIERADWWTTEPDVGRVADGVPARVDRLRSLGNAVVPQIPELIGRAILEAAA